MGKIDFCDIEGNAYDFEKIMDSIPKFFYILMDGKIVGTGLLVWDKSSGSVFLSDFEIFPELRDKGIGSMALAEIKDKLHSLKATPCAYFWCTMAENNLAAFNCYKKVGAKICRRKVCVGKTCELVVEFFSEEVKRGENIEEIR